MTTSFLASVALGGITLYLAVCLLGRSLLQRRRTGTSGWRGIGDPVGSAGWWAGVLLGLTGAGLVVVPAIAMFAAPHPAGWGHALGGAVPFGLGFALTVWAQLAMGDAWRIGVREGERTELRTSGPFAVSRNPIFTGMSLAMLGVAVWVPWTIPLWLGFTGAIVWQIRAVEEPHLLRLHGDAYLRYAARTGRFWPGIGRGLASAQAARTRAADLPASRGASRRGRPCPRSGSAPPSAP